jgi:hypothetical protein
MIVVRLLYKLNAMKCLIRIPFAAKDGWVIKFLTYQHRHLMDADGKTINLTAKDYIGKLVTSYMRKTIFDSWYMVHPKENHLRINLPINYNRYGLTKGDYENLSDILKDIAQRELCMLVMIHASLPGVSREEVARRLWEQMGMTDDDYDMEHFRRYFDRYGHNSTGTEFLDFRAEVTKSLKAIYDEKFLGV